MLEPLIEKFLPELIHLLELLGIAIITVGSIKTFYIYIRSRFKPTNANIKVMLGKSLELGLEYKMGAEILKTVLIRDMSEIWILGSIIVLRAMLSILLHYEIRTELSKEQLDKKKAGL
ncbi:MAG: DUF1622 domain-containing protein [Defluviitaleaceae bacterium]|nr:DUF1622 domain-containing protein [Defluviitaleaceae bacterium]MCL2835561.1 DUF1622 domain-containing protein [Defluviitaleaceae bacterium]